MKSLVLNIISILVGISIGHTVNWEIIVLGSNLIPLPQGVDATSLDSIKSSIHLFEFKHYISPFLAHAIGSLSGAFMTYTVATSLKMKFAMFVGIVFLFEGVIDVEFIPAPTLFDVLDLVLAYIPMAWVGVKIAQNFENKK